jgi:prolyl oligopeptidase
MRMLFFPRLGLVLTAACTSASPQQSPRTPAGTAAVASPAAPAPAPAAPLTYPPTSKVDVADELHGTRVRDPYRWLEETDAPPTRSWIEAQNRTTFAYLEAIPRRAAIRERMTALWNYERFSVPEKVASRYFFNKNDGLQNQSVLYWSPALDAEPRVLLDPNQLSADGTVALGPVAISEDGKRLAYALQQAGSDWAEWRVREVDTGADLGDHLRWTKFGSVAWTRDGKGFFYGRYPEPKGEAELRGQNLHHKLYFHRLGDPQSADTLVFAEPGQEKWAYEPQVSDDGRYLIISVSRGTGPRNLLFYRDLSRRKGAVVRLVDSFEARYDFIDNDGPVFYFSTDLEAPRGRVVAIDTRTPQRNRWREILPQGEDAIASADLIGERLVVHYTHHAHSRIAVHDLKGKLLQQIELPGLGTAAGFSGRRDDPETFFSFTSFTQPGVIYRHDVHSGTYQVFRRPEVAFDGSRYETRQVFYTSKDGTRVPMFITARKGFKPDGGAPALLYGYGGFGVSLTPAFSVPNAVWLELGGIYAQPNLRGGGEYGEEWHQAGTRHDKQKVFDDFIAAAEWLIENRFTSAEKLAISGRSNGGLLVGACMTQRPELFGAALPGVGVLDMLRFHKFTIGWAWVDDYGSPDDPADFKTLYAYSPYHNLKPATRYPATLITTGDHDDRVVPGHSFKFAAALQEAHRGPDPVLIRIETRAGHGAGKPTSMRIEEATDQLAFLVRVLGMHE